MRGSVFKHLVQEQRFVLESATLSHKGLSVLLIGVNPLESDFFWLYRLPLFSGVVFIKQTCEKPLNFLSL